MPDGVRVNIYYPLADFNKNFWPLAVFQKDIYHGLAEGTEKKGTLLIANYH